MESGVYLLVITFTLHILTCSGQWIQEYYEAGDDERAWVTPSVQEGAMILQSIYLLEEVDEEIIVAYLSYQGDNSPVVTGYTEPSTAANETLGLVIERQGIRWRMLVTKKQDYESSHFTATHRYAFTVQVAEIIVHTYLIIENIDDWPPVFQPISTFCEIKENLVTITSCEYRVTDEDGWLENITLTMNDEMRALFRFKPTEEILDSSTTSMIFNLETINQLDFEETILHIIDITVNDTMHSITSRIVVRVEDVADMPPIWRNILGSQQFLEKTEMNFPVLAVDGDIGINATIFYRIPNLEWSKYISVNENSGVINVLPIDRDAERNEIYTFTITACEVPDVNSCVDQDVTFILIDINDNYPVLTATTVKFIIPESEITSLDSSITANDIDSITNAMYSISLRNEGAVNHSSAFSVAPTNGFQEIPVYLFIINAALLDYENEQWRTFTFDMVTIEDINASHTDTITFTIELMNLNDEMPIFEDGDDYTARIKENVGPGEFIAQIKATDRDIDDTVTHTLLGNAIRNNFHIDQEFGIITTLVNNALDYEIQQEVIIQVQATDNLLGVQHRAIAQLTIYVEDVNDETPRISVASQRITIDENLSEDTVIASEITATDEDTSAYLVFSIDWNNSYATKNGRIYQNFTIYRGCISAETFSLNDDNTEDPETYRGNVRAELIIKDVVPENTPDFEEFDTIYISLIVTDTNQEEGEANHSVILPIYIENINDNDPEFDIGTITATRSATEHINNVLVGVITATDRDGDTITYTLTPLEVDDHITSDNLISISDRGELWVIGDIDADIPLYSLNYTVTASDGERQVSERITIDILDTNDNSPVIDPIDPIINVLELTPHNTDILTITATDGDRDPQFNTVYFEWNSFADPLADRFFNIDQTTGVFSVFYMNSNEPLDRDIPRPSINISIMITGFDNIGGTNRNPTTTAFTVTLIDINNKEPILNTQNSLSAREDNLEESIIGVLTATDADEAGSDNSRIKFVIINVTRASDGAKEPPVNPLLFEITNQDHDLGTAEVKNNYPLRDYHGIYTLAVETMDFGQPPQSSVGYINVVIEKFNFNPPEFKFPTGDEIIYLEKDPCILCPLIMYNDTNLPNIRAIDNQGDKWQMSYTIINDVSDTFTLSTLETSTSEARLLVTRIPIDNQLYEFGINVTDDGIPQYSADISVKVMFIDINADPRFSEVEQISEILYFQENNTDIENQISNFTRARYVGIGETENILTYYFISNDATTVFTIPEITINEIRPRDILDRENVAFYDFTITAARTASGSSISEERSILKIHLIVTDINDNPPNFQNSQYFSTVMSNYEEGRTVLSVLAEDIDEDPILTYGIDTDSLVVSDPSLANIANPFNVSTTSNGGIIFQQFTVQTNMNGFFTFDIIVTDGEFNSSAQIRIFIVTESHGVEFTFQNDLNAVTAKQSEIKQILEEEFQYYCNIESIRRDTDSNGEQMNSQTIVRVHFIDNISNEPVDRTQIEITANDVTVYSRLRDVFLAEGLVLLSFIQETESESNTEAILRGWLIGVAVLLGTLCFILLVALILKTRSLTKRLNKLSVTKYGSQESGLNRKAAPTTNKHAVEGSNPVYSVEKKVQEFDETSVGSGDSDLIGVENNPEFDYNPHRQQVTLNGNTNNFQESTRTKF